MSINQPATIVGIRYHTGGVPFEPLIEVDVPSLHSQLHLFQGSDVAALPSRFAWLVGGTICHGHLLLSQYAADASINEAAEYVGDMRQLMLGEGTSTSPEDEPTSMVSGAMWAQAGGCVGVMLLCGIGVSTWPCAASGC